LAANALASRKWRMTTLLSSRMLFCAIGVDAPGFLEHEALEFRAFIATHATGSGPERGKTLFPTPGIEAVNVAGHLYQFGYGQAFEFFDDGFDHAHSKFRLSTGGGFDKASGPGRCAGRLPSAGPFPNGVWERGKGVSAAWAREPRRT